MMRFRIVWLVARWEFLTTVARPTFVFTLLALPLAHLALAGLMGLSFRSIERQSDPRVLVVDPAGVLPASDDVRRITEDALNTLREGTADAVVVLADDYLASGRVSTYSRPLRGFVDLGKRLQHRDKAAAIIQTAMSNGRLTPAEQQRLLEPIASADAFRSSGESFIAESPFAIVSAFTGSFGVCFLLGLSIFLACGHLHTAATAEVSNRMLEMLLSVVGPAELLAGKVVGLSAAGLLQVAAYVAIAVVGMQAMPGAIGLPLTVALWSMAFFMAGYALFAVLLAATGVLAREPADSMNLSTIWMLAAAVPFFFIMQFDGGSPTGIVAVLSWMPLTAPASMLLRLGVGGLGVLERCAVLLLILASSGGALILTARLFANRVVHGRAIRRLG